MLYFQVVHSRSGVGESGAAHMAGSSGGAALCVHFNDVSFGRLAGAKVFGALQALEPVGTVP